MTARRSGILLHITSLPSSFGIGDLGPGAYRFADFLAAAGQNIWQVLPVNPISTACGNSPYCSYSAFAGNPFLISPDLLVEDGLLQYSDIEGEQRPVFSEVRIDYQAVVAFKSRLLHAAYGRFREKAAENSAFRAFCEDSSEWLDDYALFAALKERFGGAMWSEWERGARDRSEEALREWRTLLEDRILFEKFQQFIFFKQWRAFKKYCRSKTIQIVGDMPIYVNYDSVDVWVNATLFDLDDEKRPIHVAGVPPDYFSATGQLWGNPVYRWDRLRETGYAWWIKRLGHAMECYDVVRLDHFRGFVGFWRVPASESTAIHGEWIEAPAWHFFKVLQKHFPHIPIIAEDLGIITPDVREVMTAFGFPGMKVLLFSFGDDLPTNPYSIHNHIRNCVVYSGTHDNNTVRGWFRTEASDQDRKRVSEYVGRDVDEREAHWDVMRLAMMSVADTAIFPIQDILGLGEEARMNTPSVAYGNWEWRVVPHQLTPGLAERLRNMTRFFGR